MAQNTGRMIAVLIIIAVLTQYVAARYYNWEVSQCKNVKSKFDIKEVLLNCDGDPCALDVGSHSYVAFPFIATQPVFSLEFVETYLRNSNSDHVYAMAANNKYLTLLYNDTNERVKGFPLQEGESYFVGHTFKVPNNKDIEKAKAIMVQMFSNNLSSMEMCFVFEVQVSRKPEE